MPEKIPGTRMEKYRNYWATCGAVSQMKRRNHLSRCRKNCREKHIKDHPDYKYRPNRNRKSSKNKDKLCNVNIPSTHTVVNVDPVTINQHPDLNLQNDPRQDLIFEPGMMTWRSVTLQNRMHQIVINPISNPHLPSDENEDCKGHFRSELRHEAISPSRHIEVTTVNLSERDPWWKGSGQKTSRSKSEFSVSVKISKLWFWWVLFRE